MMNKALFFDRDGVINIEKNYVYKIEDFEFISDIFSLAKEAQEKGYLLIVITNQAGIGRGYYTEADFQKLTQWMVRQFANKSIDISHVYHCPYHPQFGIGGYKKDSFDRKPNPGMLLRARDKFDLDLSQCLLVGDKVSDIEAGENAGLSDMFLLSSDIALSNVSEKYQVVASLSEIKIPPL